MSALDHAAVARGLIAGINGDRISAEMTPCVIAELLEAQVHAILAVADAITEASNVGAKAIYDGRS